MPTHPLGASPRDDGRTSFCVWAPRASAVDVVFADDNADGHDPDREPVRLDRDDDGYHAAVVDDVAAGDRYRYRLHRDGHEPVERADPASHHQPDGLHGPSAVDDPAGFAWTDTGWSIGPLHDQVLYELHVGTFTPEGTFDAAIGRLDDLAELGITAIELMPVWQFAGERNWGYDGVLPYAVQDSYGGPAGLRRLVDAAHARGLGVVLDVVYNHYGPEGNHLRDFGPYFTDDYDTPWGDAVNVDGPDSDPVRRFIVENAARWVTDFHLDGLRLDAVHAVIDRSAVHWLEEVAAAVHDAAAGLERGALVIAESDLQDPRLLRPTEVGGYGLDAQWLDDIHHAVRVAVTANRDGYYVDYHGLTDLVRAARDRYVLARDYSAYRGRTVGRPAPDVGYHRFVVCTQNHDQVGNRMLGERLDALVPPEKARFAAAAVLLLPFTPMLFMGEEYAETAPFQYFVSHTEPELMEAVKRGRREEFAAFAWQGEAPDPNDPATFERSKLDWSLRVHGEHAPRLAMYRELIRLRRQTAAIRDPDAGDLQARMVSDHLLELRRGDATDPGPSEVLIAMHTADAPGSLDLPPGTWRVAFTSADERWGGPGTTHGTGTPLTNDGQPATVELPPWSVTMLVPARTHPATAGHQR